MTSNLFFFAHFDEPAPSHPPTPLKWASDPPTKLPTARIHLKTLKNQFSTCQRLNSPSHSISLALPLGSLSVVKEPLSTQWAKWQNVRIALDRNLVLTTSSLSPKSLSYNFLLWLSFISVASVPFVLLPQPTPALVRLRPCQLLPLATAFLLVSLGFGRLLCWFILTTLESSFYNTVVLISHWWWVFVEITMVFTTSSSNH